MMESDTSIFVYNLVNGSKTLSSSTAIFTQSKSGFFGPNFMTREGSLQTNTFIYASQTLLKIFQLSTTRNILTLNYQFTWALGGNVIKLATST